MKIGVLALQGAFAEHEKVLEQLGAIGPNASNCGRPADLELRQARDLMTMRSCCRAVRVPFRENF